MDAVGSAGVDIHAEEESLRARANAVQPAQAPGMDRSRKQDFIDPGILAECVKKIAAAFQLRTLEPDTIPLIALATRHRLMSLINDAVAARDHRLAASHLRPPPLTTRKRKRGEDEEPEEDDDDDEENFDDDFDELDGGEAKRARRAAAKGKAREPEPAWDVVVYDDAEKVLGVLERVDREEERKRRRERMLRDQREEEERALDDAIKASEEAQRDLDGLASSSNLDHLVMGAGGGTPGPSGSGAATPKGDETPGKDKKPKKVRKPKKDTPAVTARNMSEDVKKRLTDQVAMRQLGGRSFSWLNSGGAAGSSSGGFNSPTPGALPKPKFAPASSLPPPTFGSPLATGEFSNSNNANGTGPSSAIPSALGLGRLSNVPPLHDANRARAAKEEWERGQHVVELGDVVFALERERGMGVGKGTGRNVLMRARAGLGPKSTPTGGVGK
ncbi:hypothetical protein RQP46_000235 [Phenoliferia psychrophenolica]